MSLAKFNLASMGFRAHAAGRKRTLITPSARLPLRPSFPDFIKLQDFHRPYSSDDAQALLAQIDGALTPFGKNLSTVKRITIAYSQKDPISMPEHINGGKKAAEHFHDIVSNLAPQISWSMADSIVELKHLNRSGRRDDLIHALTARQEYALRPTIQRAPLPWLNGTLGPHFALMVDYSVEQGTTFMNMASMLEANGFTVIGACVVKNLNSATQNLKQNAFNTTMSCLPPVLTIWDRLLVKISRAEQMGLTFAKSIRDHYKKQADPKKCLEQFDQFLEPHGLHHTTLTNAECYKIVYDYGIFNGDFGCLLRDLKAVEAQNCKSKIEAQKRSLC